VRLGSSHLCYCTNIHPGESWDEIRRNVERYLPLVKQRVSPNAPFGVGLRLSAAAAQSLCVHAARAQFAAWLHDHGLYVFSINGFPYGPFHGRSVKADVYLPDWRDSRRLEYTNRLADLLAFLLPPDEAAVGSISTVPGAFKPNAVSLDAIDCIVELLLRHVAHLVEIERDTGRRIVLALEPEPCCLLETIEETVGFFRDHLHSGAAAARLATLAGVGASAAHEAVRKHLGVCLDLCHAAVEFEDPARCLQELASAGIAVAKVQVTAGLRIPQVTQDAADSLGSFDDAVYLHQVVERGPDGLRRYEDIGDARESDTWRGGGCEWRVHFHVPVFLEDLAPFSSTQSFVREALALHKRQAWAPHLEVETYTWSVLPACYRTLPVEDAIARELKWVQGELA
jgi:sugar phosphate isomerase/epimerase